MKWNTGVSNKHVDLVIAVASEAFRYLQSKSVITATNSMLSQIAARLIGDHPGVELSIEINADLEMARRFARQPRPAAQGSSRSSSIEVAIKRLPFDMRTGAISLQPLCEHDAV